MAWNWTGGALEWITLLPDAPTPPRQESIWADQLSKISYLILLLHGESHQLYIHFVLPFLEHTHGFKQFISVLTLCWNVWKSWPFYFHSSGSGSRRGRDSYSERGGYDRYEEYDSSYK